MASVHVLPNPASSSRKQGHLEAGKKKIYSLVDVKDKINESIGERRAVYNYDKFKEYGGRFGVVDNGDNCHSMPLLEEFRKRKAEGRAKKAISSGQVHLDNADSNEKLSHNHEHETDGSASSNPGFSGSHTSHKKEGYSDKNVVTDNENFASVPNLVSNNHFSSDVQAHSEKPWVPNLLEKPGHTLLSNGYHDHWRETSNHSDVDQTELAIPNVDATDSFTAFDSVHTQVDYNKILSNSSFYPSDSDASRSSSKAHMSYLDESASAVPEVSVNGSAENELRLVSTSVDSSNSALGSWFYNPGGLKNDIHVDSQIGKKKISESKSQHLDQDNAPWHTSTVLEDPSINIRRSGEDHPFPTSYGATSARSRPSFLDALGISRDFSTSHWMQYENMNANPPISNDAKLCSVDIPLSSNLKPLTNINGPQHPSSSSNSDLANEQLNAFDSSNDVQMLERSSEHLQKKHELLIPKKDETFSALEQHIEDLTQEKFALQRALDTSRTVSEALAAENSSLTESYNQQAKLVIELRSDIERLQDEVKDQLGAVESLKLEYANAQLECHAADERAKILAAEVIGLEEKALRLRSNELKLEKQIEGLSSEMASYKRKLASLEKERQDFQSTINAMQEEKKLLQSKLRKAPTNSPNHNNTKVYLKKDMATSTEDLVDDVDGDTNVTETMVRGTMTALLNSMPSRDLTSNIPEERTLSVSDASIGIPQEQLRMIDNINSLLSELAVEKEELMQALTIETSNNSKLKDLNKELSRKLEAQTQRLELLTAQRMANENILTRTTDVHNTTDTMEYADEGDEVVERVLSWIMKLFPGGSSRRRTSKLL